MNSLFADGEVLDFEPDDLNAALFTVMGEIRAEVRRLTAEAVAHEVRRQVGRGAMRSQIDLDGGGSIDHEAVARVLPSAVRAAFHDAIDSVVGDAVARAVRQARGRLD
jgi:hypothetical protein